ncbi:MAG: GerMN domain-containing protein [Firmicutes bacterium]|nr:GerMN domain-containing protein [Bacillota bacterium]
MRRALLIVLLLVVLVGIAWLIFDDFQLRGEIQRLNRELRPKEAKIAVFFIKSTPTNFYLKPVLVPVGQDEAQHLQALKALFAGPPPGSELTPVFAPETKLLDYKLENGLATVNLNREATRLNVGAQGEYLAVASIVNTLTKLPEVFQVKILIEGNEVESLAGHVDLTGVFEYDNRVVTLE